MRKHISPQLPKLSYAAKLGITYILVLFFPLALLTFITYQNHAQASIQQSITTHEKALIQAASFLEYKLTALNNMVDVISYDVTVQNILKTGILHEREMLGNWFFQKVDNLQNIIFNPYVSQEIESVKIYPLSEESSFESTKEFHSLSPEVQQELLAQLTTGATFNTIWLLPSPTSAQGGGRTISLVKKIPDFSSINKSIGLIKGDIPLSVFQTIVEQTVTTSGTYALLATRYGEPIAVVSGSHPDAMGELIHGLDSIEADGTIHIVQTTDATPYLMGHRKVGSSGWRLSVIIPIQDIMVASLPYRQQMTWITLLLLAMSIPIIIYTTSTLTSRIKKLQHHVTAVSTNGFSSSRLENGQDEIGDLTRSFDDMAEKISTLLSEQFHSGYKIKDLEFRLLQATINPHFLYNSLDLIYWTALQKKDLEISHIARSLSLFYKLSLGHGQFIVPLKDELELVRTYIEIQNLRFGGKIHLTINIPQYLMDFPVFKILLQPLVENAILHGIREKESEEGTIAITAQESEGTLTVSVSDDGVGMPADKLLHILQSENQDREGYGVWNIHERIRLSQGDGYGLEFSSTVGSGTTVRIKIRGLYPHTTPT